MTTRRHCMLEDLQLLGFVLTTQQCYIDAVRPLMQHYRRAPDQFSDEEPRQ